MKIFSILLLLALPVFANEWTSLFDGKTLKGWTHPGTANWEVKDGAITVSEGKVGLLTTEEHFDNFELEVEFRASIGANSGVFLNCAEKIKDVTTDCYEVNIADAANPFPTGSIVKCSKVEGVEEKDDWRKFHLKVEDGTVTITLDGKLLLTHEADPVRPAGSIGLQKNKGTVSFRNIRVRQLK